MTTTTIRAIKGFDADLSCRGHKFEVGQTYTVAGEIVACKNGFHAIPEDQHPLAVFSDYPPAGSRYANTVASGRIVGDGDKIAAEVLHVSHEITLRDLTLSAVEWVMSRAVHDGPTASGYQGAATASGEQGAATASGYQGCAIGSGPNCRVIGDVDGIDLFAREFEWDGHRWHRISIACGTTGEGGIKPGVWYRCVGGALVEADQ